MMARHQYERAAGQDQAAGGEVAVASYDSYAEAERAVDHLSDQRFPVEHAVIVGRGLRSVEHVTGRMTTWRSVGQSALSGALLGALLGWIFGLFNWVDPLITGLLLALYGAVFGALIGALMGGIAHAMTRGRRDFTSVTQMQADRYDLLVEASFAAEATRMLATGGGSEHRIGEERHH